MLDMLSAGGDEFAVDQSDSGDFGRDYSAEIDHELVLIGAPNYGLEVELSGYVALELESLQVDMYLEGLYLQD